MQHTAETFWAKVKCGNDDECWEWQGYTSSPPGRKDRIRYGRIDIFGCIGVYAHRVAFFLSYPGEIALRDAGKKVFVLHKCDNHICCNPSHLYLGDHAQNMRDMYGRNRHPTQSVANGYSQKITADDIRWIRLEWQLKRANKKALAMLYGVSTETIKKVVYPHRGFYLDVV